MTTATAHRAISPDLKAFIVESVYGVLEDPDFGMDLSAETKRRLRAAQTKKQKTIPLSEIKRKFARS